MGSANTTGSGVGDSSKPTLKDLAVLANAPAIMWVGTVETDAGDVPSSPPTYTATVKLPSPLAGGHAAYAVLLTSIDAGGVNLSGMSNNGAGEFSQFQITSEEAGEVQFMVVRMGVAPEVILKGRTL